MVGRYVVHRHLRRLTVGFASPHCPSQARPKTDSWLCSSQLALCDAEPKADLLLEALGWSEPINPVTLARQLVALSQHFAQTRSEALSKNLKNELSSKLPR